MGILFLQYFATVFLHEHVTMYSLKTCLIKSYHEEYRFAKKLAEMKYIFLSGFYQEQMHWVGISNRVLSFRLKLWVEQNGRTPLLVGKTLLNYKNTIEEAIGREMLSYPKYITKGSLTPKTMDNTPIYNSIFSGLKYQ